MQGDRERSATTVFRTAAAFEVSGRVAAAPARATCVVVEVSPVNAIFSRSFTRRTRGTGAAVPSGAVSSFFMKVCWFSSAPSGTPCTGRPASPSWGTRPSFFHRRMTSNPAITTTMRRTASSRTRSPNGRVRPVRTSGALVRCGEVVAMMTGVFTAVITTEVTGCTGFAVTAGTTEMPV